MSCPNHMNPLLGVTPEIPVPVLEARYRLSSRRLYQEDKPPREVTCELCKRAIEEERKEQM